MNLFALAGLSVGISCLLLSAITVYFGRTRLHRLLLQFNIVVAVWGFGLFLVGTAQSEPRAIFAWKMAHLGGFLVGPAFYHMVSHFCEKHRIRLLYLAYAQAIIFNILALSTNHMFYETRLAFGIHYHQVNPLYILAVLLYLTFVIISYYELGKFLRKTRGIKRIQTLYIIFGFLIGYVGATSSFLPMFGLDIIYPFGNLGIVLYSFILAFAIFRYRLMDIHLILKRTLVYSLSAGLLTGLFLLLILGLTKLFTATAGKSSYAVIVIAVLIGAILFDPLKNKIQSSLDKVFYKTTYNYYAAIQNLSRELAITTNLKSTCRFIIDEIFSLLNLKRAHLLSDANGYFQSVYSRSSESNRAPAYQDSEIEQKQCISLSEESPLVKFLDKRKDTVVKVELAGSTPHGDNDVVLRELEPFQGEIAVPVFIENKLSVIFILGEKLSEEIFTKEDINLLETIANQSAIAIRNARLYDELEIRVKERTSELAEANILLKAEISERKLAEKNLEQSNRELQEFAYVASHDLQEPLRKVKAFGDRLKDKHGKSLTDQGRDYLERMQSAAERMQTLINGLLMYSRVTTKAQPFAHVDLATIAKEVVSDLEIHIEQSSGKVEIGELPTIDADPLQMRQLLQNLIGNALKFNKNDEPPLVKVSTKAIHNNGHGTDKELCEIIIEDNGIGFDPQYTDRIFEVFQRLHGRKEYAGSGIGLSVCKKIVERHGGSITARSEPGEGAAFIVTLPVKHTGHVKD